MTGRVSDRDLATRFSRAREGNVALMFALLLFPLLVAGGIAIDLYRSNAAKVALGEASDAAVLAAARAALTNPSLTTAGAEKIARRIFDAHALRIPKFAVVDFTFANDKVAGTFTVSANGALDTTLMRIAGVKTMDVDAFSEARNGEPRPLEIVLALDNTGSMNGQKMDDLKAAANELVDAVMLATSANKTKVGIVPFARHVNVGVSRRFEPWLDAQPNGSWEDTICTVDAAAATAAGCTEQTATCEWDGAPYSCQQWICPSGDAPQTCTTETRPTAFLGCAGSRSHPLNIEDRDYFTNRIPGIANAIPWPDCPAEITPMSLSKSAIATAINNLFVQGETYIPSGLFWAQALISENEPFTEGESAEALRAKGGMKAIVLMTDGENTASLVEWGGHYGSDKALADQYTTEMCDEIKKGETLLYTIAFSVSDASTTSLLRSCATAPNYFYDASDSEELFDAFEAIAKSLIQLALTK